jgi:CHAT domain-containing protein
MLGVKNPVCIILCFCSALMACNREDTEMTGGRDATRFERIEDPVELLRVLETAKGFNRALVLEKLYLTKEAIYEWNEVARKNPERSIEARQHLERLQQLSDPVKQWSTTEVDRALEDRDEAGLTKFVRLFPTDAARYFERTLSGDRERARLFAKTLTAAGDPFPQAVVDAMDRTKDRAALDEGLTAFHKGDFQRAATLLERAGNPLSLAAHYYITTRQQPPSLSVLDAAIPHLRPEYHELSSRIYAWRANVLEFDDRYLEAQADYKRALAAANGDPTSIAAARARESWNFATVGNSEEAFRDAHRALNLLTRVADTNTRNQGYAGAANAAAQLGYPDTALLYQNAAVEDIQHAVAAAPASKAASVKIQLSVALRKRAEIHVQLKRDADAQDDLEQAADFAEASSQIKDRDLLRMRRLEVRGQVLLLQGRSAEAATIFSEAIELAKNQDSTYRAILHFDRGEALRKAGDPRADDEVAAALKILHDEVGHTLTTPLQAASEPLWTPYFLRFRDRQNELMESRITAGDIEGAFVYSELARAFEPMQILLQVRPIETRAALQQARAGLPADTVILQYLVLPQRTYTWVVTRERIVLVRQRTTKADIERWIEGARNAVESEQDDPFIRVTRAAYAGLLSAPLSIAGPTKSRIIIVPDEPMQGLPFNALRGPRQEGYLIERGSVAVDGSTSLYLYALARDRQLSNDRNPTVLLVGDPAFEGYPRLLGARMEVEELSRNDYPGAEVLVDTEATVQRFLADAKKATIIHFAGHALSASLNPWQSRLLLAPHGRESGELTAQRLFRELPHLERTRLVVLSACSSAAGGSLGPQGLAPLVRPLIAGGVPAVVGSLWKVKDASTKQLLVLLHCHYRHGDDVAVALRNAQLEMLRKKDSVRAWAAFQVVGFAGSPYPRSTALEEPSSEHVCTQNSLLGPDGLHSQ